MPDCVALKVRKLEGMTRVGIGKFIKLQVVSEGIIIMGFWEGLYAGKSIASAEEIQKKLADAGKETRE